MHVMAIRRQGVGLVSSKKARFTSLFIALMAALFVTLLAPSAFGAVYTATFTVDPTDAIKNQTITSSPLSEDGDEVTVHVTTTDPEAPIEGLTVTLTTRSGAGLASTTSITGNVATTVSEGYATFPNLKISASNEPALTDYQLEATVTVPDLPPPSLLGTVLAAEAPFSEPFDIWDAGCLAPCARNLRGTLESYRATDGILTLSEVTSANPGTFPDLQCPGQRMIFASSAFTHASTGADAVKLVSTITKGNFRDAGTNYGQAHVEWCIGLSHPGPWNFAQQDTNGDDVLDLYVGSAPRCPNLKKKTPAEINAFAPCIVSQVSDGKGGSITTGWLPAGDPPRRT
jgi:hypothetical protein